MNIQDLLAAKDVDGIRSYCAANGLAVVGNRIVPKDPARKQALLEQAMFWEKRQLARKILLG